MPASVRTPMITPLGDAALLVRFGDSLDETANRAAIAFAERLEAAGLSEIIEIDPNLVSVLLRYDPLLTDGEWLASEIRLLLSAPAAAHAREPERHQIAVAFGGADGPDLDGVAAQLHLDAGAFTPRPDDTLVTLHLDPGATWVSDYYPVESVDPSDDGSQTVTLRTADTLWLSRLLWRLGGHARVVSPPEVAAAVRDGAKAALAAYEGGEGAADPGQGG